MSFQLLSPLTVIIGSVLLAFALFALQFLRPRVRQIVVATSLFWQQAQQQAPVRALWQRFRYPLAWLLSLLIVLAIWLALAGLHQAADSTRGVSVYYLDGSFVMKNEDNFEGAKAALNKALEQVSRESASIWFGGATLHQLSRAGDNPVLVKARIETLEPAMSVSPFAGLFQQLQTLTDADTRINLYYFGPALTPAVVKALPENIQLKTGYLAKPSSADVMVAAPGYSLTSSGDPAAVDVSFSVDAGNNSGGFLSALRYTLDGEEYTPGQQVLLENGRVKLADVPLASLPQRFTVSVHESATDTDTGFASASLMLPAFSLSRVWLDEALPPAIARLFAVDNTLRQVSDNADIAVCVASSDSCLEKASRRLVLDNDVPDNTLYLRVADSGATRQLADTWRQAGWQVTFQPAGKASVAELRLNGSGLERLLEAQSQVAPLLVLDALHQLSSSPALPAFVTVGTPLNSQLLSPLALTAGNYTLPDGQTVLASLPATFSPEAPTLPENAESDNSDVGGVSENAPAVAPTGVDFVVWLILLAMLLLMVEWLAVQRGKLP